MASWADELDIDDSDILLGAFRCNNSSSSHGASASALASSSPGSCPLPSSTILQRHSAASVLQRFRKPHSSPLLQDLSTAGDERRDKTLCNVSSPDGICKEKTPYGIPSQIRNRFFTSPLNTQRSRSRDLPGIMYRENYDMPDVDVFSEGDPYRDICGLQDEREPLLLTRRSVLDSFPKETSLPPDTGNCRQVLGQEYSHKRKLKSLFIDTFGEAAQKSKQIAAGVPNHTSDKDNGLPAAFLRSCFPAVQTPHNFRENESDSHGFSSHRTNLSYLIPGPAGAVQQGMNRAPHQTSSVSGVAHENCKGSVSNIHQEDFDTVAWNLAMKYLEKFSTSVSTIGSIKSSRAENRIPKLVAIIKTCASNGCGDVLVNLKDETDTVAGIVNRRLMVETEFGRLIEPGAVILLHQLLVGKRSQSDHLRLIGYVEDAVAVFSPTPYVHYLNITINNVEQVFHNSQELAAKEFPISVGNEAAIKEIEQTEGMADHSHSPVDLCAQISTEDKEIHLLQDSIGGEHVLSHIRASEVSYQGQVGARLPSFVSDSPSTKSRMEVIPSTHDIDYDQLLDDTDILQCLASKSTNI